MKRSAKFILIAVILSLTLAVLFLCNFKIAGTHDELISIVREELAFEQDDTATVTYAGEFLNGTDVLLWFIIQDDSLTYYRAVECQLLSDNSYLFKEIHTPMIYSKDIVHVVWKAEDLFLVNDTNCRTIITRNQSGDVISQVNILPNDYPYIFHLAPPAGKATTSFLDSRGNEVR